VEGER